MAHDRFASTIRKLEDLPSDSGRVVDTLAGANLRIFVRLNQMEQAYRDLSARVRSIEERSHPAPAPTSSAARTTADGRPDRRGSTAASRFALRTAEAAGRPGKPAA